MLIRSIHDRLSRGCLVVVELLLVVIASFEYCSVESLKSKLHFYSSWRRANYQTRRCAVARSSREEIQRQVELQVELKFENGSCILLSPTCRISITANQRRGDGSTFAEYIRGEAQFRINSFHFDWIPALRIHRGRPCVPLQSPVMRLYLGRRLLGSEVFIPALYRILEEAPNHGHFRL